MHITAEDLARIDAKILHALTEYDRKQSTKKHYNRFALGIYCEALNNWRTDKDTPSNPLATLPRYFTTLQDKGEWFHLTTLNKAVREIKKNFNL